MILAADQRCISRNLLHMLQTELQRCVHAASHLMLQRPLSLVHQSLRRCKLIYQRARGGEEAVPRGPVATGNLLNRDVFIFTQGRPCARANTDSDR